MIHYGHRIHITPVDGDKDVFNVGLIYDIWGAKDFTNLLDVRAAAGLDTVSIPEGGQYPVVFQMKRAEVDRLHDEIHMTLLGTW